MNIDLVEPTLIIKQKFINLIKVKDLYDYTKCWNWNGAGRGNGYAGFCLNATNYTASRMAYRLFIGTLGNLHVLHTCDNRKCVNPFHMRLGTNEENVKDKIAKNRNWYSISPNNLSSLKLLYSTGNFSQKDLARKFKISQSHVSLILSGKTRNHGTTEDLASFMIL